MNDEISLGNLAPVLPRTLHRQVAEGKGRMDLFRPACPHVARSGFDAASAVNHIHKQGESAMTRPCVKEGGGELAVHTCWSQ